MKSSARDEIIHRAVLEKLSEGFNFFSADDILTVAGIDAAQLQEISDRIMGETKKQQEGRKKPSPKRRTK